MDERSATVVGSLTHGTAELGELSALVIEGARSLAGIEACVQLDELTLFACTLPSLRAIPPLRTLRVLRVLCCAIEDWSDAEWPAELEEIEIDFSSLTDARALLERPHLRRLVLFGLPLDATSYDAIVRARSARPRRLMIDCDPQQDWALDRALADRGSTLTYSEMSLGPLLVRPGLPQRPGARVDALNAYGKRVEKALATLPVSASDDALLEAGGYPTERLREDGPSYFMAHWQRGDDVDATAWIEGSSLDDEERSDALRFVARFPSLGFIRERAHTHVREEAIRSGVIPTSFKRSRETLATVERPNRRMTVLFDGFDFEVPERLLNRWYEVGLLGRHSESLLAGLAEWASIYPIGFTCDGLAPSISLAMSSGVGGPVLAYEDIELSSAWKARAPVVPTHLAFRSWASLLGHVCAVRVDGREILAK